MFTRALLATALIGAGLAAAAGIPAPEILRLAERVVRGRIAQAGGDHAAAVRHFEAAVALEDRLAYTEPPYWYYPTRQSLGKALLAAGDAAGAEAVYRRDLELYPHNGWSMYGLVLSLEAQGKAEEAAAEREMFQHAWSLADVELTASRL